MRLLALAALALGCAAMYTPSPRAWKVATSGVVGCAPDDVSVVDTVLDGPTRSWVAYCQGRKYFCSSGVAFEQIVDPRCKEAQAAHAPTATAPAPQ